LVDREVASEYVTTLRRHVEVQTKSLTIRLDPDIAAEPSSDGQWRVEPLGKHDIGREFMDPMIGVLAVDSPTAAIEHIRRHGSTHTEGVIATDKAVSDEFTRRVDAATIVINGSLRLHDGPRLGLGAEISIATGRLHVRGPVTLGSLVTSTWVVDANGALRG
jgi:glutamate-5-semialdehyde dehydrogenase